MTAKNNAKGKKGKEQGESLKRLTKKYQWLMILAALGLIAYVAIVNVYYLLFFAIAGVWLYSAIKKKRAEKKEKKRK